MDSRDLLVALLIGCYGPTVSPGGPCSDDGSCPIGQWCHSDRCLLAPEDGGSIDTPLDTPIDTTTDAPPDTTNSLIWSTPIPLLGSAVNTAATESDPTITGDRLTLFFIRTVGLNDEIFVATRAAPGDTFLVATPVVALNSSAAERSPEIGDTGDVIVFTSNRSGDFEVYASMLQNGTWSVPGIVNELSSTGTIDNDVAVAPNRLTALISRGPSGARKLFESTRSSVSVPYGAPVELTDITSVIADVAAPTLTNSANTILFHTNAVRDLFVTEKVGGSYPPPSPIAEVNTMSRDAAPFILQGADYLLFERAGNIFETSR